MVLASSVNDNYRSFEKNSSFALKYGNRPATGLSRHIRDDLAQFSVTNSNQHSRPSQKQIYASPEAVKPASMKKLDILPIKKLMRKKDTQLYMPFDQTQLKPSACPIDRMQRIKALIREGQILKLLN